jgi:hypothetical protein
MIPDPLGNVRDVMVAANLTTPLILTLVILLALVVLWAVKRP